MGNSVNKMVSDGSTSTPEGEKECEKLKKEVNKADDQIKEEIAQGSDSPESARRKLNSHKASTVTASKSQCGRGKPKSTPAYSSLKRLPTSARPNYAQGTQGKKSNMCPKPNGRPFKYTPKNGRSSCNHTEGRLIEDLFKEREGNVSGCSLTMKIKWKRRSVVKKKGRVVKAFDKKPRDVPCPRCEKTICQAIHCGLQVFLCRTDEDGKERKHQAKCPKA